MFELGLRLAFDKPTIIIKDDKTRYEFDTAPIEHLEYPRELRFSRIVDFQEKLSEKIRATHEKATSDENYTTVLKHFGEFKVAAVDTKRVTGLELILDEIQELKSLMISSTIRNRTSRAFNPYKSRMVLNVVDLDDNKIVNFEKRLFFFSRTSMIFRKSATGRMGTITFDPDLDEQTKVSAAEGVMQIIKSLGLDGRVIETPRASRY